MKHVLFLLLFAAQLSAQVFVSQLSGQVFVSHIEIAAGDGAIAPIPIRIGASPSAASPQNYRALTPAYVTKVYDGDGCRAILPDGEVHVLRLANVDAPEFANLYTTKEQPYARQSRDSLRALILKDTVYVDLKPFTKKRTSYGREVVDIYLKDGRLVNEVVVKNGWAWSKLATGRIDAEITDRINAAYIDAKKADVGLWGIGGYKILPGTWRFRYRRQSFNHFKTGYYGRSFPEVSGLCVLPGANCAVPNGAI